MLRLLKWESLMISAYMGRYYSSKKEEADSLSTIQTWALKKHGFFLTGFHSGTITWTSNWSGNKTSAGISSSIFDHEQSIRIFYTYTDRNTGEKEDFDYKIILCSTPCNFGGIRYWFICPWYNNGIYCGRRVGNLYLSGKRFDCRHCNNLSYSTRNLGGMWKSVGKIISVPNLEDEEKKIKRKYYAGKMTRRYKRFLQIKSKSVMQLHQILKGTRI